MLRSNQLRLILVVTLLIVLVLVGMSLSDSAPEDPQLQREQEADQSIAEPRRHQETVEPRPEGLPMLPAELDELPKIAAEDLIEAAELTLEFRCQQTELVSGIEIELMAEFATLPRLRLGRSDENGLLVFADLQPGTYRWRHDGQLDIVAVPKNEVPGIAIEDGKVAVRESVDRSSGALELKAGEKRHLIVPFQPAAIVTGRVVDRLGTLSQAIALRLISRERFRHPNGTEVLRILSRQVGRFPSGEFRFERIRPGEMELLGYFNDETGISQLRHEFFLQAGETRDLGALSLMSGRDVTVELKARGFDGREIPWSEIFAGEEPHRVVALTPPEPDETWAYQKIEVPLGRAFQLRGLGDGDYDLNFAVEDEHQNPPREGWIRSQASALKIAAAPLNEQLLYEDWRRVCALRLNFRSSGELSPGTRLRLFLLNVDQKSSQQIDCTFQGTTLELQIPEGNYRILVGRKTGEPFLAADSGAIRLTGRALEANLDFQLAGRLQLSTSTERGAAPSRLLMLGSGLSLDLPRGFLGSITLDLPPGNYQHEESGRSFALLPGDIQILRLD